ncbi:MAG: isopentenyl phosphate kinase [Candidatus Thermoplasmatota archaeon]|nr:isopentenyl phosphate kinase [Candidatus Thermoplasmatota archaeon]
MIAIKLGGSVITNKEKECRFNKRITYRLAGEIAEAGKKVMIVHGAGSFGHPQAKKHGLHKGFVNRKKQIDGISLTHFTVRQLNLKVMDALRSAGIPAVSMPPFPFPDEKFSYRIGRLVEVGLMPVTFGDVLLNNDVSIISGDALMETLSKELGAERAIFVTNVDGIYADPGRKGSIIRECSADELNGIFFRGDVKADVTSGMAGKVRSIKEMVYSGIEVDVVNGRKPGRLRDAINGKVVGTRVIEK